MKSRDQFYRFALGLRQSSSKEVARFKDLPSSDKSRIITWQMLL